MKNCRYSRGPPFFRQISWAQMIPLGSAGLRVAPEATKFPHHVGRPRCWASSESARTRPVLAKGFFETCTYMIGYDRYLRYLLIVPLRKWVCIQLELGFFRIQITSWWWCSWWFWSSVVVGCFVIDSADEIDDVGGEECGIEAHRTNSPTTLRMCRASPLKKILWFEGILFNIASCAGQCEWFSWRIM